MYLQDTVLLEHECEFLLIGIIALISIAAHSSTVLIFTKTKHDIMKINDDLHLYDEYKYSLYILSVCHWVVKMTCLDLRN